jgi:hypothetical protein
LGAAVIDAVARRLGAHLKRLGPHEYAGPCPVCGGRDRFSVNTYKEVWNCRHCGIGGDAIDLARHVLGVGFDEAREFVTVERSVRQRQKPAEALGRALPQGGDETRTAAALALWAASVDPRGALVEHYLQSRGLELDDDTAGEVLRWHSGIGAMIALFRNIISDEPQAISRTFLDPEGRKLGRKFLGPVAGAAIKLDADDTVLGGLHIGEGIETCMAARKIGLRPTWALGSAGAIAAFPVLCGIEALTVVADHDANGSGERAAREAERRWIEAGREVVILRADAIGADLNDAIRGALA